MRQRSRRCPRRLSSGAAFRTPRNCIFGRARVFFGSEENWQEKSHSMIQEKCEFRIDILELLSITIRLFPFSWLHASFLQIASGMAAIKNEQCWIVKTVCRDRCAIVRYDRAVGDAGHRCVLPLSLLYQRNSDGWDSESFATRRDQSVWCIHCVANVESTRL